MTSKVQLAENYWTNDVKMTSKVQPAADYWTIDRENLGTRLCYIWWAEKQRAKWRNSFKNEEIFWMNNKAITEVDFRRIWRILHIKEGVNHRDRRPRWISPSKIWWILHTQQKPNSVIALLFIQNISLFLKEFCYSLVVFLLTKNNTVSSLGFLGQYGDDSFQIW